MLQQAGRGRGHGRFQRGLDEEHLERCRRLVKWVERSCSVVCQRREVRLFPPVLQAGVVGSDLGVSDMGSADVRAHGNVQCFDGDPGWLQSVRRGSLDFE